MIFGDGVGASLFEALIANAVFLCDADALLHWNSAAEEGAWGGLKPDLRGGTRFTCWGSSFGPPCKETYLKRGQKVDPLKSKVVPWRVQFWPFIVANLLKRLFQVEADLTSNSCDWNLELGRPLFARLLFLTLWGPKKGPLFVILVRSLWQERLLATWLWLGKGAGLKF